MAGFEDVQRGDFVVVVGRRGKRTKAKVTRTNKTQIVIGESKEFECKYRRKDGKEVGGDDRFYSSRIEPYNEEKYAIYEAHSTAQEANTKAIREVKEAADRFGQYQSLKAWEELCAAWTKRQATETAYRSACDAYNASRGL